MGKGRKRIGATVATHNELRSVRRRERGERSRSGGEAPHPTGVCASAGARPDVVQAVAAMLDQVVPVAAQRAGATVTEAACALAVLAGRFSGLAEALEREAAIPAHVAPELIAWGRATGIKDGRRDELDQADDE